MKYKTRVWKAKESGCYLVIKKGMVWYSNNVKDATPLVRPPFEHDELEPVLVEIERTVTILKSDVQYWLDDSVHLKHKNNS